MASENTEKLILEAAEEEFMLKGFDGAKTTAIAAKAGVTHAMLHYYFRTKQNIFERVVSEKLRLMSESIIDAFNKPGDSFEEKVVNGIRAHFDFLKKNASLPRFVVNELVSNPDRRVIVEKMLGGLGKIVIATLQTAIDANVASGRFKPISALDLIVDIVSLNVFPFITLPIIMTVASDTYKSQEEFLENRRREVEIVILDRLIKQ